MKNLSVRLKFEVRDLWVGVYWTRPYQGRLKVYVCILPCLPILFDWDDGSIPF